MRRFSLMTLVVLASSLTLLAGTFALSQTSRERKVTLRLLLPHSEAKVTIDGKLVSGTGLKRTVEHSPSKEVLALTVVWKPNHYTTVTRQRRVTLGKDTEVMVDVRRVDPANPDAVFTEYIATPPDAVEAMCQLARVGKDDVVYDLGCGDGRIVITAVKMFGARRGVGIDLDPKRVEESRANAKKAGVAERVEFRQGDVLKIADLSDATVVMLYIGETINLRLRPILEKSLRPGARIVSHHFTMGDWEPTKTRTIDSAAGYPCELFLWEIAKKSP